MTKIELKQLLESIKNNDYKVPTGIDPFNLSLKMISYIGDTDSDLRDKLIYSILYMWIDRLVLTQNEIYELFRITLSNDYLIKGLDETDDSVFIRTFSVLIIATSVMKHRENNFIPKNVFYKAFNKVLAYYNNEKDVRGFIEGKGWAHGAAHGADALDEFAKCSELGKNELKKILDAIYNKVNINYYGYIHFEDERMVTVVESILDRDVIPYKEIEEWIESFSKYKKINKYPEDLVLEVNVSNFLKSLFFRLSKSKYKDIRITTENTLKEINPFLKNAKRE